MVPPLVGSHALGTWSLRSLTWLKRHQLACAQFIEPRALAGRVVEELFAAIVVRDEAEALVNDQPLDSPLVEVMSETPGARKQSRTRRLARLL